MDGMGDAGERSAKSIMFNCSKEEDLMWRNKFQSLISKLNDNWNITKNECGKITNKLLSSVAVFILPGPTKKFTEDEFNVMKKFLSEGGSILVLHGGERNDKTNINFLLEEYGIMINNDIVIRPTYMNRRYFYPQECLINDGIINHGVSKALVKMLPAYKNKTDPDLNKIPLEFVFPFGSTLNVARPAVTLLSTGNETYPIERSVLAVCTNCGAENSSGGGKIAVLGSVFMFADMYLKREDNDKVREIVFKFLTTEEIELDKLDAEYPDLSDYIKIPAIHKIASQPMISIEYLLEEITENYFLMWDFNLISIHADLVPDALKAYSLLKMERGPLQLIAPRFISPLPRLQPQLIPPIFRDMRFPALEMYDLEEAFSSKRTLISQLANKFMTGTKEELKENRVKYLEYFVLECGRVLNINVPGTSEPNAKQILHKATLKLAKYKYHRTPVRPKGPTRKTRIPIPKWISHPTHTYPPRY